MLKRFYLLPIICCLGFSCARLGGITQRQLVYLTSDKQELRLNLPAGKAEENYKTDMKDALEQYFAYEDGSVIYVARNTAWPTPNGERVKAPASKDKEVGHFSGSDSLGLYWKEIHIEEFMIGYSRVPAKRVESFERALGSVRIR